jgi:CRP/FNR family transcriptional regulator, dissimilatory nitrate respiration regulator
MAEKIALELIKNFSLFGKMADEDKLALSQGGHVRRCLKGQMLFGHGEPVTHFYLITKGAFQLFRTNSEGHEKTVEVVKAGQTMCESEILDACRAHRVNAMPIEDSEVIEFPVPWLKNAAKQYPAFALNLLSLIASHSIWRRWKRNNKLPCQPLSWSHASCSVYAYYTTSIHRVSIYPTAKR